MTEIKKTPKKSPENFIDNNSLEKTAIEIGSAFLEKQFLKIKQLIENYLNLKNKKDTPKISIEFFFAPHNTSEDVETIEEKIKEADIFIPEIAGWEKDFIFLLKSASKGEPTTFTYNDFYNFLKKYSKHFTLIRLITNSQINIEVVDLPFYHFLTFKIIRNIHKMNNFNFNTNFSLAVEKWKSLVKQFAYLEIKREKYILKNLEKIKNKIIKGQFPDLKDKKNIKILLSYGSVHTTLYHLMNQENISEKKYSFPKNKHVFSHFSELIRRITFGFYRKKDKKRLINEKIIDNLSKKSIFEQILLKSCKTPPIKYTLDRNIFIRKIIDLFNDRELENLFETIRHQTQFDFENKKNEIENIIKQAITNKGIKWPETEEDVKKITSNVYKVEKQNKVSPYSYLFIFTNFKILFLAFKTIKCTSSINNNSSNN